MYTSVKLSSDKLQRMFTRNRLRGSLVNSEDPDEMQHYAAFHRSLHCLLRIKEPSWTEIHHYLENSISDPLKCTMDSPILMINMGNSIRIQRVKFRTILLLCFSSVGVYISQVIKRQRVEDDTVIELLQKLEEIGGVRVSQKFMLKRLSLQL